MKLYLLIASALFLTVNHVHAADKPNVLFLFADDMTYEAISAYDKTDIDTPNLDKLVKRGTTFSHAYNMGGWNGAICVASRTMLLTGRSIWHAEKLWPKTKDEVAAGRVWPKLLKEAGYDTYFTGKWHIRADAEKAFDVARHVRPGMPGTVPESYSRPPAKRDDPWSPTDRSLGGYWEGGIHWSEVVANDAIDYLDMSSKSDHPFFMYIAFNAPHDPRQSPQEYLNQYPISRIKVPYNYLDEYPHKDVMGAGKGLRDEALAPFPRTKNAVQVHRKEYYALVSHLDAQIGRILEKLKETGQEENTLIVFTADHGLAVGHHGLLGKQNMYDHSLRVPFTVVGPGIPADAITAVPIYLQDVVPTTLELAGVEIPNFIEFESVMRHMGKCKVGVERRDAIYGAYLMKQRAVISDGFKLILYPEGKIARLYDLKDDPQEMHDLADKSEHRVTMKALFAKLLKLQKELDDPLDLTKTYPDLR